MSLRKSKQAKNVTAGEQESAQMFDKATKTQSFYTPSQLLSTLQLDQAATRGVSGQLGTRSIQPNLRRQKRPKKRASRLTRKHTETRPRRESLTTAVHDSCMDDNTDHNGICAVG